MKWYEKEQLNFSVGFEDTFIPQSSIGKRSLDEYALTSHYDRWFDDIGLIAQTGANQARWGIPWYLVNPERGEYRFDWLDRVVERFQDVGVEVIVDLMHYGTPLWLDNSFINKDYEKYVAEYSAKIADRYSGKFDIFTPLNEPLLNCMYCGEFGYWPPNLVGTDGFVKLLRKVTRGMVASQKAIQSVNSDSSFVNVEASFRFAGAVDSSDYRDEVKILKERRFIVEDLIMGKVNETHPLYSWLVENGMSDFDFEWYDENEVQPDVIGVNYYPKVSTVEYVEGDYHTGGPEDTLKFKNEGVAGLKDVLKLFSDRYNLPVYLTETSWPGPVDERKQWLYESVSTVDELREQGMNLIGYTWWSLFDMVYWAYRDENKPVEKYLAEMGLWDLRPNGTLSFDRVRTSAVDTYRHLVDQHRNG